MKSLSKLILPFSLFISSTFFTVDSKAQDFIPERFRNYKTDLKTRVVEKGDHILKNGLLYRQKDYHLDEDTIADVVEIYFLKFERDSLISTQFPVIYFFRYTNDSIEMYIDEKMDGLNGNEYKVIFDFLREIIPKDIEKKENKKYFI